MAVDQRFAATVVTVSDGVAQGVRDDSSGRAVATLLEGSGFEVRRREIVPDDQEQIAGVLRRLADAGTALVVTTGGTGLGPRDVTPEATRAVIERDAPGLAEEMRAAGRGSTPFAALSRGIVGSTGATLIVNLPGSERGAVESLNAILPTLPHALRLLAGHTAHDPAEGHGSYQRIRTRDRKARTIEQELEERRSSGEEVVLATAVKVEGSPPCRVGQKLLLGEAGPVAGTLGCAEFDRGATADAPEVLAARSPATRVYTHELGSVEVFLEPFLRRPQLVVFSATPVALTLMRWARDVGFDPVLVEPRAERLTDQFRAAAAGRTAADIEDLRLDEDTAALHTDHDAPAVAESTAALLRSPVRFIGVMGSARHVGPHVERLREMGFSDQDLARIRTPVGVDVGARTAEEIALSILAGLVADRRGATPGWLDRR
jgi:molybdenum cofactor biosynthesis protein B